ncbi:phosphotransferase family protein [Rossellomorea aquimaris]|uniref:phosphotransferase family protein n=1 Tax=Rossellomorea aquimaris TaxID=189382 RepID=UPI0007D04B36|nr:aminoglycoside phosphotransferase family protein [Rossellomorea aquimaris]
MSRIKNIVQEIDSQLQLLRMWQLKGGVSANVTAIEVMQPNGKIKKMVVREHGETDRKQNPRMARDEFNLLKNMKSAGVLVPEPLHYREKGSYILIEYIEGKPDFTPSDIDCYLIQAASNLVEIHRVECSEINFLPKLDVNWIEVLRDFTEEGSDIHEPQSQNQHVILHGDFWPGNILWRSGELVSIIDWEDASVGDPLSDLSNARLEMLWAFGVEAMTIFTHLYQSKMPHLDITTLPYWDLWATLKHASSISSWGLEKRTEETMREQYHWFAQRALQEIKHK